jgi:hypothetical protein
MIHYIDILTKQTDALSAKQLNLENALQVVVSF